ncbi:MAG: type I DNA topoisomerase [Pseudomonadota bacterium]
MTVVVVESPAKAKTINQYLGPGYTVLASYGHVRDLVEKDGSVDPDNNFEMRWEVAAASQKHVRAIADALAGDNRLVLATDPDREGEAISWHLLEALRKRRALKKDAAVARVVFNAITKSAVTAAMERPRDINMELVEAYLARRALDYLVGFTLSPVLWRKLPGAKSAGRVQSVALRLIVEREMEIEAFRPREYWSVTADLATPGGAVYTARLVWLNGAKLDRFGLADEAAALAAVAAVQAAPLTVAAVEAKPISRAPAPPFMTSTLQQEASRKLSMGAQETMRTAQKLYEAGHITYMRTDGIDMAPEAVSAARAAVESRYGVAYVPQKPRHYKNKAKNAQEAHECIRPTEMTRDAAALPALIGPVERRLYDLIWKRALASQMESARLERTTVDIASADGRVGLRATGQVVLFDGFLKVYEEGRDETPEDEESARLPAIRQGEVATRQAVTPAQHFTQPPPRYTEATLVKKMEELGIGRPSTYASIVTTIQDRGYVEKDKGRLSPQDKGRLVTAFLSSYFQRYVGYDFTAGLEEELDDITAGKADWQEVLNRFWRDFRAAVDETAELRITDVLEKINEVLAPHLFPDKGDGSDPRLCPTCSEGRLSMRTARSGGAFIGCSTYPECRYTRPLAGEAEAADRLLGQDPAGLAVHLKSGRFGPYVQLGDGDGEDKPKRASIPKGMDRDTLDLDKALALLSLPRRVGPHPEDGETVEAGIGRFGPFVRHGKIYANIPEAEEVFSIGMNRAMALLAQKAARGRPVPAKPLKELGAHPEGGSVAVMPGRYGPYVKWEKVNATLPGEVAPEDVTLEQALALIAQKRAKSPTKRKAAAKTSPAKKAAETRSSGKKGAAKTAKSSTKKGSAGKAAPKTRGAAPSDPFIDDAPPGGDGANKAAE